MYIRLTPFTRELTATALSWAIKEDNTDFFRRMPPLQDWFTEDLAFKVFSYFYVVWDDDKPIGLTGLTQNDPHGKIIDFCLLIDSDAMPDRREAGCAVVDQMSEYVFNYMNYNKMVCKTLSSRKGLGECLELLGWECEGNLRQNIFYKGEWRDEKFWATFQETWRAK